MGGLPMANSTAAAAATSANEDETAMARRLICDA
jgi:hypothetical protein